MVTGVFLLIVIWIVGSLVLCFFGCPVCLFGWLVVGCWLFGVWCLWLFVGLFGVWCCSFLVFVFAVAAVCLSVFFPALKQICWLQEEDRLSLVMECMEGGELFDRVREKKVYSEKDGKFCQRAPVALKVLF